MSEEPIDLSALDPSNDQLRQERLIRAIASRAQPALAERAQWHARAEDSVARQVVRWQRGLTAAAMLLALPAAGVTLWQSSRQAMEPLGVATETSSQIATAIGVPADLLPYLTPEGPSR